MKKFNESYGHILGLAFPVEKLRTMPLPDQALANVNIGRAQDIHHLISWNAELMETTLEFTESHLKLHPALKLRQKYSTADESALASIRDAPARLSLDHVIALDEYPGENLVIGLGRPSSKWSGRKLTNQLENPNKELLWPPRQLAKNICKEAKTRYGYIQTDEELVAYYFGKVAKQWKVAIMPIPWSRNGVNVLTTDLAVVALYDGNIGSSSGRHRERGRDGQDQ